MKLYEKEIKEIEKEIQWREKSHIIKERNPLRTLKTKFQTLKQCQKKHDEFVEKLKYGLEEANEFFKGNIFGIIDELAGELE